METKTGNPEREEMQIDLLELCSVLLRRAPLILLAGLLAAAATFAVTETMITPMYESVTKVYVLSRQSSAAVTYTELQTGTQLVRDYMQLVKSRPVLEKTIAALDLELDTEELAERISTETEQDTRIFSIKVRDEDPGRARDIANTLREAVSVQIKEVMDVDLVNTVEDGSYPMEQASPNLPRATVIGGAAGAAAAAGVFLLIFLLDDTIKTPADVEQYLELNVLASIPITDETGRRKKREPAAQPLHRVGFLKRKVS